MKITTRTNQAAIMLLTAILAVMVTLLPSCAEDDPDIPGYPTPRNETSAPSLVMFYKHLVGLYESGKPFNHKLLIIGCEAGKFDIQLSSPVVFNDDLERIPDTSAEYNQLRQLRGDTCFYRTVDDDIRDGLFIFNNANMQQAFVEDIIAIDIIAETDFDDNHPAGSSLTDMVYVTYTSYYDFIQNQYQYNENGFGNGLYPGIPTHPKTDYPQYIQIDGRGGFYTPEDLKCTYHRRLTEISSENPIIMVTQCWPPFLSFETAPKTECSVEVRLTLRDPLDDSIKEIKQTYRIE